MTGWASSREFFVVGKKVLGDAPEGALSPIAWERSSGPAARLQWKGSASAWRKSVARLARHSSLLMCLLCAPFAAPLMRPLGTGSFMLVVSGRTRVGKSLGTLLAASAVGFKAASDFPTWSATDAALEQMFPTVNDLLLPLEDIMTMGGSTSQKLERLDNFAYRLSSGREKERHASFQASSGEWMFIAITQAEAPLAAMALEAGHARRPGATIRAIDLPAVGESDEHIFDLYNGGQALTSERRSKMFSRIVDGCAAQHGWAFQRYIEAHIGEGANGLQAAQADVEAFVARVTDGLDGDEARDLARKFGVFYAGGCRAIAHGVLPFKAEEIAAAVEVCYRRSRALLQDEGNVLRDGLRRLRSLAQALPKLWEDLDYHKVAGFRMHHEGGVQVIVKVEQFAQAFVSVEQRRMIAAHLLGEGIMVPAKRAAGTLAAKEQVVFPDGERRRAHEFRMASLSDI